MNNNYNVRCTRNKQIIFFFRKQAITKLANVLNCTRIMTAENEHKLSIQLLSNVALGRGSQIALDIVWLLKHKSFLI